MLLSSSLICLNTRQIHLFPKTIAVIQTSLEDYDQYDHVDNPDSDSGKGKAQARSVDKC